MPDSMKLVWDKPGERFYDVGVDKPVLFPLKDDGTYDNGVAWNGMTNVTESPSGGDVNDYYANNKLYASLRSVEKPEGSIEAYTYPDEFAECDGSKELVAGSGVFARHQKRRPFGLSYRSFVGEGDNMENAYIIHILYGLTVSPSERSHDTINEDPDLEPLSWDYSGMPVDMTKATGFRPMGAIEIDSRKVTGTKLTAIENALYGTDSTQSHILLPDDIYDILTSNG